MDLNDKIVIYRTADGQTSIDVKLENETVWLSANQMATLFDRDEKTIRKHINNVFSEDELEKANNTHFLRVDGVKQPVAFYSLDVIISVGYRVKSQRGTQFRIWANKVLKEYLVKGYAVNKALTEQRYTELKQLVAVLGRTVKAQEALVLFCHPERSEGSPADFCFGRCFTCVQHDSLIVTFIPIHPLLKLQAGLYHLTCNAMVVEMLD